MEADRFNEGKRDWTLIDFSCLETLVDVLKFGSEKYGKWNWRKGQPVEQILASTFRHLIAIQSGQLIDKESGLPHTGHLYANIMFLEFQFKKDDYYR